MEKPLVSVIIPSYNRFKYLLNAIESVYWQNYKNIEIIIINDHSSQKEYYSYDFPKEVIKLDLEINQKNKLGYVSAGHIRNFGIKRATGKYIATLDDDDIWLQNKLDRQIDILESSNNRMSCTDGLIGEGAYDEKSIYKVYNQEHFYRRISKKYTKSIFFKSKKFSFPDEFNFEFLRVHNSIITSSVLVERELLNFIGGFRPFPTMDDYAPDYDCWLGLLRLTNCDYISEPLFYYDSLHGSGRVWGD
jgi:glycosyltransferase involved in cell wall biosynthesis